MVQQQARADDRETDSRRWSALAVCLAVGFMTLLDVSIVNVALPSIESGIGASSAALSWVVSGYALAFGLVLVPAGRVGDARGRKVTFIAGLVLFVLASASCGLATGAVMLVVARLVQGVAAGFVSPQVSGLIQQLFTGADRAKAFGLFAATIGISTAVGPLLGGILIELGGTEHGWRYVFMVNVPIGIAAVVAAVKLLPASPRQSRQPLRASSFDPVGIALLGTAVLALMLPLVQERQWQSPAKWLLVVLAVGLIAVFVWWERRQGARGRQQLVDLSLFSMRSYTLGCVIGLVYFAGFTTIFFIYSLYLQQGLGYSALQAGLAVTTFALGSAVSARLGGSIVGRFGRSVVAAGLAMVIVGMVTTVIASILVPGTGVGWAAAVPLLLAGFGSGLVISPNLTITLDEVPVHRAGIAGGVLQTGQRIGSAAGIALVGAVFFGLVSSTGGDWARAFQIGLSVAAGLVTIGLVIALVDMITGRSRAASSQSESVPQTG